MIVRRKLHYHRQLIDWFEEREKIFAKMYSDCQVVTAVPVHNVVLDGPGGNATYQGTMLNYSMLKELMSLMLEQEQGRRKFGEDLKKTLHDLVVWELEHPVPQMLPFWPWQQKDSAKKLEKLLDAKAKDRPVPGDRSGSGELGSRGLLSLPIFGQQAKAEAEGGGD